MTVVALASVKHAPGVTTTAAAMAAASGVPTLVVEADPSGGDIAARARLPLEPGLVTLAASGRHPGAHLDLDRHAQLLPAGGLVVVAPPAPELASAAVATVASRLPAALAHAAPTGIVDCGRLSAGSPVLAAAAGADLVLLLVEPTVAAVEHLRTRLPFVHEAVSGKAAVLLVGDRPYPGHEVEAALGVPVVGAIAVDPRGVAAVHAGGGARRSLLVRSVRTVLDAVEEVIDARGQETKASAHPREAGRRARRARPGRDRAGGRLAV
jgi:hypothetical protein